MVIYLKILIKDLKVFKFLPLAMTLLKVLAKIKTIREGVNFPEGI